MDRTVEGYLAQLRAALAGADPALVQDAAYDAEEYLRDALAETDGSEEGFDAVVEAYGTPEEIASSYRDAEITVAAALRKPVSAVKSTNPIARFFGVLVDPSAWGALFYMVLSLATGIVYFTIVVTGLSLTVGLAVLIVGLPFALLFLALVRAISLAEGRMVEGLLGERMPRRPSTVGQTGGIWERIKSWLTDYRTWTTMLYMVLQMFFGIAYFTAVVTAFAVCVSLLALPFVQVLAGEPLLIVDGFRYWIEPWGYPVFILGGLLGVVGTMWIAKGVGKMHAAYAKAMLVGRFEQPAPGTAPVA
ncbi:MAG: sensor domain-containing protein [Actinomycetota bacterium]|nr:sensor domain-containing protein [Actinomycetota bacterium]